MAADQNRPTANPFDLLIEGKQAQPRPSKGPPLAWLAIIALILALLWGPEAKIWATQPARPADLSNYETIVTGMAKKGLLRVSGSNDAITWNNGLFADDAETATVLASIGLDHCRAGDGSIGKLIALAASMAGQTLGAASGPDCKAMVERFRARTFLKQDMASTSDAIWDIRSGDVRAMAKGARIVPVVSSVEDEQEPARLLHTGSGQARQGLPALLALVADGGTTRQWALAPGKNALANIDLSQSAQNAAGARTASAYCFHAGDEGSSNNCNQGVTVALLGNSAIVSPGPKMQALSIALDGRRAGGDLQIMHPGSKLTLARRNGEPLISLQLRPMSTRLYSPPGLAGLEMAYAQANPDKTVRSTIDLKLHRPAQALLDAYAASLLPGEATSFRASVTMMDGMTGAIRALPTFPHRKDQLVEADRTRAERLAWLDQNSNFVAMPVGSSAKVPLAASITHVWPDLARRPVTVSGIKPNPDAANTPSVDTVDGWKITNLGKQILVESGSGTFDLASFVQRSNNYYAMDLMKQALCRQEFDAVSIGEANTPLARICRNSTARDPNRQNSSTTGQWTPIEGSTAENFWPSAVWKLTCAVPSTIDKDDFGGWQKADPSCGDTLWPGVTFGSWSGQRRIQPAPIRLNFDQVDDVTSSYGTYLLSILGGGQSLWSGIDLARAYSRVVTMRAVQPRMTQADLAPAEPFVWWQAKAKGQRQSDQLAAWQALMDGMQRVPVNGTASGLIDAVGNDRLIVFAKTGTPDIDRATGKSSPQYQALSAYLSQGCLLRYTANGLEAIPLRRCADARRNIGRELAEANRNNGYRAALDERYQPGDLVSSIPNKPGLDSNKGHVLVLVFAQIKGDGRLPRGADFPAKSLNPGQFCAIRTVAINFQERDDGNKTPAIGFARQLMSNGAFRAWIGDRKGCNDAPAKPPTTAKGRS